MFLFITSKKSRDHPITFMVWFITSNKSRYHSITSLVSFITSTKSRDHSIRPSNTHHRVHLCASACLMYLRLHIRGLQGYLAYEKQPPPRNLR